MKYISVQRAQGKDSRVLFFVFFFVCLKFKSLHDKVRGFLHKQEDQSRLPEEKE